VYFFVFVCWKHVCRHLRQPLRWLLSRLLSAALLCLRLSPRNLRTALSAHLFRDPTFVCEKDTSDRGCGNDNCACNNEKSCTNGKSKNCTWMLTDTLDKNKNKQGVCCKGRPSGGRRLLQSVVDPCTDALAALNDTQKAQLPTQLCPIGSYGIGGELASVCTACEAGTTTQYEGSTTKDQCNSECLFAPYWMPACTAMSQ
jgi:hypothetical protein